MIVSWRVLERQQPSATVLAPGTLAWEVFQLPRQYSLQAAPKPADGEITHPDRDLADLTWRVSFHRIISGWQRTNVLTVGGPTPRVADTMLRGSTHK